MTQAGFAENSFTQFQRGVGVGDVVVGQLLALELLRAVSEPGAGVAGRRRRRRSGAGSRRSASPGPWLNCTEKVRGKRFGLCLRVLDDGAEPVGDGSVVGRRCGRRLSRASLRRKLPQVEPPCCVHVAEHLAIVGRVNDDGDGGVVLGGGADHGGAADVDVLDAFGVRGAASRRSASNG